MKQTDTNIDLKPSSKKPTKSWTKRVVLEDDQTNDISSHKKIDIENYCNGRIKNDFNKFYSRYYFSEKDTDFVRLVDYYPYPSSPFVEKKLKGVNYERVEREHTKHLVDALEQARHVINNLQKTYRQRILDSPELNNFLLSLLNLDNYTKLKKDIQRFDFALNLFTLGMKILIEESPKPIRKHMIKSMKEFYDMAKLPSELGHTTNKTLIRPIFIEDEIQIEIIQPATKPRYQRKNKSTQK